MSEHVIGGQICSTGYDSISPLGPNPEAIKVGHLILLNQNLTLRMPLVVQPIPPPQNVVYHQSVTQQTPRPTRAMEEGRQRVTTANEGGQEAGGRAEA